MTPELTYTKACVANPQSAGSFLARYFGFTMAKQDNAERKALLVSNGCGNNYCFIAPGDHRDYDKPEIIINTDDCLRDYHRLNKAGILFKGRPYYTQRGLEVILTDTWDNIYKIVEKRDYNDEP